jgi:hypothetical protein
MPALFWWVRHIVLIGAGLFFLLFGIQLLVLAYRLDDPFNFVMTFFASNLIILISATILVGLVIRMVVTIRGSSDNDNECD